MSKKKNSGLGRGLDSLIPSNYYDKDFDSNSSISLEDMLNEKSDEENINSDSNEEIIDNGEENSNNLDESEISDIKEDLDDDIVEKSGINDELVKQHVNEVMEIVHKNPRITLWSVKSSAVFRYLRKTQPEFSISKEASSLIDEAVSNKYPDIWALFDDQ